MLRNFHDYWLIRKSRLFDDKYYLLMYDEVRQADVDPLMHYLRLGWKMGYNPSVDFDTNYYLRIYEDVRLSGICPFVHFIQYGKKEGRISSLENERWVSPTRLLGNPQKNLTKYFSREYGKKAVLYLKMYGFVPLLHKIGVTFTQLWKKRSDNRIIILGNPTGSVSAPDTELSVFEGKVSVIIPTKNAGREFKHLLKMLRLQKGVEAIEIVVVDSGSTDNTLDYADGLQAKVVQIKPEEFTHSYARNVGAENASGDFLLFTVQDAIPPTDTWLYEMMSVLIGNSVSAVSCAEFPREDSDLFYRVVTWNHYRFLDVDGKDQIFQLPTETDSISLRRNGQLSDLACLIPSEIFHQYKYRLSYAEDLDLGIRLIRDGRKIAFLGNTRIIHSHSRNMYYFLKRGYVDNIFLTDVFSNEQLPKIKFWVLLSDIIFTFSLLNNLIGEEMLNMRFPIGVNQFIARTRREFENAARQPMPRRLTIHNERYPDELFIQFLKHVAARLESSPERGQSGGFLLQSLLDYSNILFEYIFQTYEFINEEIADDIVACLHKQFAQVVGANLAFYYKQSSEKDKELFIEYFGNLGQGV